MEAPFTQEELEILRGKYPSLAKTLNTSDTYLKQIANGLRVIKSSKSIKCYKKLKETVEFFTPKTKIKDNINMTEGFEPLHKDTFILCANKLSLSLYKISREALIQSNCYDFFVYKNPEKKDYEEWETFIEIDEETYFLLYNNLCNKFRKHIVTPMYLNYKKTLK